MHICNKTKITWEKQFFKAQLIQLIKKINLFYETPKFNKNNQTKKVFRTVNSTIKISIINKNL
jgi:hypothetical protein